MVNVAELTNTPAPTRPSVPVAALAAGAATAPLIAMLASPNLEPARVAPTQSPLTVLAVSMGRLAKASVRANAAVPLDSAERQGISVVLAASLYSELVILLDRTLRPTARAALIVRHVLVSVKEGAVALLGTAELVATFVLLAVNQALELVTVAPATSRQTGSVARTARRARDMPKVNVAVLLGTVELAATSAAPVVRRASGLATAILEAFRQTASVERTAKPAKDIPRVNVAALRASADPATISAVLVARLASGLATADLEPSRRTANVERTARPVRVMPRVSVAAPLDIAGQIAPSAARAASPPLAHATVAPEAFRPPETAVARTTRRAKASQRASAAARTATAVRHPITAPPAARALLAYATAAPAPSRLMEPAAARMVESAKGSRRESAAAQTVTVAIHLATVELAARTHSECAMVVQTPFQQMGTAPRTGRLARAHRKETAVASLITAASRLITAALDVKSRLVPVREQVFSRGSSL